MVSLCKKDNVKNSFNHNDNRSLCETSKESQLRGVKLPWVIECVLHVVESLDGFCLEINVEDKTANEASGHNRRTCCSHRPIEFT